MARMGHTSACRCEQCTMSILKQKVECGCEQCWASIAVGDVVCECDQCWNTIGSSPRSRLEETGDEFILQRPKGVYTGELRPRSIRIVKGDKAKRDDNTPTSLHAVNSRKGVPLRSSFTIEDLKKEVAQLGNEIAEGFAVLRKGKQW